MGRVLGRRRHRGRGAHQLAFGVRAAVPLDRVDELRGLLGRIGAGAADVPAFEFNRMQGVHFARVLLLDRDTVEAQPPDQASLVLMTEIDAPLERHLDELADLAAQALDATFGLCDGYPVEPTPSSRRAFLAAHQLRPAAAYVNTVGRTLEQIHGEAVLRERIETFLDERHHDLPTDPAAVRAQIQQFVRDTPDLRWALHPPPRPSLRWRAKEGLHAVAGAAGLALAAPVALLALPAYAVALRAHERSEPAPHIRPSREHEQRLAALEDFAAQNPFSAVGYVKPGGFRHWTLRAVLWLIDYSARHVFTRANLAGVKTIHFARWTPLDDYGRVIFTSNYDGSLESYNDDFIDKVAFGLNAAFSNGVGYPRTKYLLFRGARREQEFKDYLRRHQIPTQIFYSAYDQLSAVNIENNALIRSGLPGTLAPAETTAWLQRL